MFLHSERGVLNMATGTGKTRTALKIVAELFDRNEIDTVIVCTDGNDLLDQWYGELLAVRRRINRNMRVFRNYSSYKELLDFVLDPKNAILLVSRDRLPRLCGRLIPRSVTALCLSMTKSTDSGVPATGRGLQACPTTSGSGSGSARRPNANTIRMATHSSKRISARSS